MKTRYSLDNVSSKMYDYIRDGVVFDLGRMYNYSLDNYYPDFRSYDHSFFVLKNS